MRLARIGHVAAVLLRNAPLLVSRAGRVKLKARQAERRQDWAAAQALWLARDRAAPNDAAGLTGVARCLLAQGKLPEAQQRANALRTRFPQDPAAATMSARIAAARHDWSSAMHNWDAVLARAPHDDEATLGRMQALMAMGRFAEVEDQARALAASGKVDVAILLARNAAASGDAQLALERWRQAATRFPHDARVLRDLGLALAAAGEIAEGGQVADRLLKINRRYGLRVQGQLRVAAKPSADLTDFWAQARREFAAAPEFYRREIDAALRAGRVAEAAETFRALMEKHAAHVSDAAYVVGFWKQKSADADALKKLLLKKLWGTSQFRPALLRLSRMIFAREARSRRSFAERTRVMVDRAHMPADSRAVLARVLTVQQGLERNFLDSDVSRDVCRAFIAHVHGLLAAGKPAAFVRLGDADANCLPYEPALASFARADAMERETVWWGAPVAEGARAAMAARVLAAVQTCDVVGVPGIEWFLRDIDLERNDSLADGRSGRGLRATLHATETGLLRQGNSEKVFASAHLHQNLQFWNLYGELFDTGREAVLVSPHPDLADAVGQKFNLRIAANILTPARHASMGQMEKRLQTDKTLPQVIDEVLARVAGASPGRIVIVGAGYLGKLIVAEARAQGAFAFDAGSAVDAWMGIRTRSYLD